MDLPGSGQEQIAGSCEHGNELRVLQKVGDLVTRWGTVGFSRRTLLHGVNYANVLCKRLLENHKIFFPAESVIRRTRSKMHAALGYTYHFRWKENCYTYCRRNFASVTRVNSVIKLRNRPLCMMMTLPPNNQNCILKSLLVTIIKAPKVINILYIYYQLQKQATHSRHSAALLQTRY